MEILTKLEAYQIDEVGNKLPWTLIWAEANKIRDQKFDRIEFLQVYFEKVLGCMVVEYKQSSYGILSKVLSLNSYALNFQPLTRLLLLSPEIQWEKVTCH